MIFPNNRGRFADLLYVLTSVVGFFAMGYVPDKIIVHANAATTASNIAAHETLLRIGVAGELIGKPLLSSLPSRYTTCLKESTVAKPPSW